MIEGWICSYRAIWEHPIFAGNAERVGVWDWLLKKAAWKETRFNANGEIITLERGQACISQRQVTKETGMSRQSFRTFIKLLEAEGAVQTRPVTKSTRCRTLVTICKYDKYQGSQPKPNPASTQDQPTKEQVNNIPVGGADESAPADPDKIMFDGGRKILADAGVSKSQAGKILGKWRKQSGTAQVIAAIGRAQREGAIDPVAFIEGCLRFQAMKAPVERPGYVNNGSFGNIPERC